MKQSDVRLADRPAVLNEMKNKIWPGRLMLIVATLFFMTSILRARSDDGRSPAGIAIGALFLSLAIISLRQARRQE